MNNPHLRSYQVARAGYQSGINDAVAKYQNAQLMGDLNGQVEAQQEAASYQTQMEALDRMMQPILNPAPGPKVHKYGLTDEEVAAAHASVPDRTDLKVNDNRVYISNDDKERMYAENKQKYRNLLATGQYTDARHQR